MKERKRERGKKERKEENKVKDLSRMRQHKKSLADRPLFSRRHATLHLAVSVGMSTIRNWIAVYPALFSKKQIN